MAKRKKRTKNTIRKGRSTSFNRPKVKESNTTQGRYIYALYRANKALIDETLGGRQASPYEVFKADLTQVMQQGIYTVINGRGQYRQVSVDRAAAYIFGRQDFARTKGYNWWAGNVVNAIYNAKLAKVFRQLALLFSNAPIDPNKIKYVVEGHKFLYVQDNGVPDVSIEFRTSPSGLYFDGQLADTIFDENLTNDEIRDRRAPYTGEPTTAQLKERGKI